MMKTLKTMLLAGVALAGLGGIAAADPCDPPAPQPTYGTYQNGSYEYNGYQNAYDNSYDDYDYRTDESQREAANREPAPGTYQNGYVWVAGAYSYPNGVAVWMPGHWVAAARPAPIVVSRPPVVIYRGDSRDHRRGRTARSYRWRSRW